MSSKTISNSRTGKSLNNLLTGVLSQVVILVLNFVVRYVFVQKIGYEYLGINSLFTSILTVLSVADLGFGSALGIVLYSSLAKKDEEEIAGLMNFFKKVYLVIGLIVTAVGLAITPFVQYLVNTDKTIPNLPLYFLLFLLNTVSSYFISYRAILIRADQKNSVVNNVTTAVKIAKAVLEIGVLLLIPKLLGLTATYFFYLGIMVAATYAIGIMTSVYAKKKYPYAFDNKITVNPEKKKDIISTTKDLFVYRLCAAFSSPIDSIIISVFVGTLVLGIYSNYLLIYTTLLEFICLISRNIISSVGNFVVERPLEEQKKLYFEMQIIYFAIIIFCTINFVSLVSPFISFVFKEGSTLSVWTVFLMGITLISKCAGELSLIFRETTRIYKKTKYISLFYTALHIGLSLLFGYFFGLEGILLGNAVAYFVTNFWFELFALFKWYFKSNPLKVFAMYLYVLLITCGISVGMYFLSEFITSKGGLIDFVIAGAVSVIVSSISLLILYPLDGFKQAFNRAKHIVGGFLGKFLLIHNSKKIQISVLVGYVVSLTVLILLRDLFAVNIDKIIFLLLLVVAVLLSNKEFAVSIILFTLPISSSLSELYILIFALIYFVIISFKRHSLKNWALIFAIPLLLFLLEVVLSSAYGSVQLNLALRIFTLLSILAVIFYDRHSFSKIHLLAFVFGVLYLFVIVAINWLVPSIYGVLHKKDVHNTWLTFSVLFREVRLGSSSRLWILNYTGLKYPYVSDIVTAENPNNIGLLSIVSMTSLYTLYGTTRNKKRFGIALLMLVFIAFGIWSLSRTFIIFFLVFIIFAILAPLIAKRTSLINSFIYFSFIALVVLLILLFNRDLLINIFRRFSEEQTATGNGRLSLIGDYFRFIFSDWRYALFGVGCANLNVMSQISDPPHTNFVQFIGSYGLVTFLIFAVFFVVSFKRTKFIRIKTPQLYYLMPIIFTIGFTFTLQLFLPSIVLLSFVPSVLCLSFANKHICEEKQLNYYPSKPIIPSNGEKPIVAMCAVSFGGGVGSYIKNITPYLIEKSVTVSFVFNPDTTDSEEAKFSVFNTNNYKFNKKRKRFKITRLYDKYIHCCDAFYNSKPNLIYINTSSYVRSFILIFAALRYKGAKIIIHCHDAVNSKTKLPLKERIARWFLTFERMGYFACSEESGKVFFGKNFLNSKEGLDAVINNFVDTDKFKFDVNKREEIRNKENLSKEDIVLGNVGRFDEQKNQKFIIDLISRLPDNYKAIIIAGGGTLKQSLEEQSLKLSVSDRIKLIDRVSNIDKYYCAFDHFVLPSLAEGLPFVSVEAQCSGLLNIINCELPKSTKITENVVFLPLDLNVWEQFIKNTEPNDFDVRSVSYKDVEKSGFSKNTAPYATIEKILHYIYE